MTDLEHENRRLKERIAELEAALESERRPIDLSELYEREGYKNLAETAVSR